MEQNTDNPNPSPESLERGYEVGDISIRAAAWFLPIFAIFVVLSLVFLYVVQNRLTREPIKADRKRSVIEEPQKLSDAPPLQPMQGVEPKEARQKSETDYLPAEDLVRMHDKENKHFEALGWKIDSKSLMPRPPDELMDQVVAKTNARQRPVQPASDNQRPAGNTVTPIPQRDQGGRQ